MGYSMSMVESKFFMHEANFKPAFKAYKKYNPNSKARTIFEAFDENRWHTEANDDGINKIGFNGENMRGDEEFLDVIAPFVQEDSYIQMVGEEGEQWRWIFKDGKVEQKEPKITWD